MVSRSFVLVVFVCLVQVFATRDPPKRLLDAFPTCPTYLTVSTKGKTLDDSPVVINWGPCKKPPKWIGFYDKDPSVYTDEAMFYVVTNSTQKGTYVTNSTLTNFTLPVGWNRHDFLSEPPKRTNGHCLSFYAAAYDEESLMSLDCLKIQPSWMNEIKNLKQVPLKHMFIPGTHCSGCYNYQKGNPKSVLLEKFGFTQNFDVWTQLVLGIRYLDISVGYNDDVNEPEKFWAVHENLFITPVSVIVRDVRRFMSVVSQVIIMDFGAFPIGFNRDRHLEFIRYLESELKHVAYPNDRVSNSYDLTIEKIETQAKCLIIYDKPDMEKETNITWPAWKRFTTRDLKTPEMRDYMRKVFSTRFNGTASDDNIGWSFFGMQGVEASYTPGRSLSTTRERAVRLNYDLSLWLGGTWSLSANVVALDYFFSTNLVDMAIHINREKASRLSDLVYFDME